jgi:hypothetical protein
MNISRKVYYKLFKCYAKATHTHKISARNGQVYAGIPYRNSFLFLNFIPVIINIYYVHLHFSISLAVYPCFAFKKYTKYKKFHFEYCIRLYRIITTNIWKDY